MVEPIKFRISPELSNWKCYMFGNDPIVNSGLLYQPIIGNVPNFFVRWMMKICFACVWIKEDK